MGFSPQEGEASRLHSASILRGGDITHIYLGGDSESIHGAMIGPELECCKCRVLPYNYNNNCHPEASGIRKGG